MTVCVCSGLQKALTEYLVSDWLESYLMTVLTRTKSAGTSTRLFLSIEFGNIQNKQ